MCQYTNLEVIYISPSSKLLRGKDSNTGNRVVLKTGGQEHMTQEAIARLRREYQIMQRIDSPHVVKPLGEVTLDGRCYLVEEFCPGITLSRLLKQGALEMSDFYRIAEQLVMGLRDIHKAGVVHKDVNPANIMYDAESGRVVLLDFGISSMFMHEQMSGIRLENIEGTLRYIAPEQTGRMNTELDYRADFYSLGITLYQMLTGRYPFDAETPTELVFSHIAKTPPDLRVLLPNVPPMLAAVVDKLLSKMAKDRYLSSEGLLYDLTRCQKEKAFVLGKKDFSRRFEFTSRLYGREEEIAQLKSDFKEVATGSRILVSISGYSGIGKTSLVNQLQGEALRTNGMFLQGKFDQYHANVPYFAFFEAIKQFCNMVFLEPEEVIHKWKEILSKHLGNDAALLTGKVAELSLLTGNHPISEDMGPLEERTRFKSVLEKLLSLLAAPEHPLVLFLDDVHRADMGSLEMLEELFKNEDIHDLMIIMCYRDNEVSREHPLTLSLNKIIQRGGRVTQLNLKGLDPESTVQMLGDIFITETDTTSALADILYRKTKGNPFYIKQFLRLCHSKGYLKLDMDTGSWSWKEAEIRACPAQENVVEFLTENLNQFSEETISLLSFGACIGQSFSVEDLSAVCGLSEREINRRLITAVEQEAVYPMEKHGKTGLQTMYQFTHDRFQQVFYTALSEKTRASVHYLLGKRYEERSLAAGDLDEWVFEIADHYAMGLVEAEDQEERRRIQEFLLSTAHRCGLVSAFDTAERYLNLLLSQPELKLLENRPFLTKIYMEYHAALCNLVKEKECDRIYEMLCNLVVEATELVDNCCLQISSFSNRGRYEDAFEIGLALLGQLKVTFPGENIKLTLEREIISFYQERDALGAEDILNLKEAEDPVEAGISKLLCRLCGPTFFFNPDYSYWTVFTAVRRMFRHGYTPHTLQMYSNLMMPLGELRRDYQTSYVAGRSAMRLAEKHQYREVIYSIYCMFALHTGHWFEDVVNEIPYAKESIKGNAQMGDFEYACYGYYGLMMAVMESATHVDELWNEVQAGVKFAEKTGSDHALGSFLSFQQLCRSIRGELSLTGSFDGDGFSEQTHLERFSHNLQAISYYHVIRALSAVIYRDYSTAFRLCRDAVPLLPYVSSFYNVALHNFLYSLSICQILETRDYDPETRPMLLRVLKENQDWLKERSNDALCNYGHLYLLIEAERKAAEGRTGEALRLYEEALGAAKKHDRSLHHAILCDVAALRYERLGIKSSSSHYLTDTYRLYGHWGAEGKCARMRQDYPELGGLWKNDSRQGTLSEDSIRTTASLDMSSVLKASQAISEELELEGILEKLIHSLLECAGAQHIYYLSQTDSGYEIQSEGHSGAKDVCIVSKRPAKDNDIPLSIVSYVERTLEAVILDDGENSRVFGKDIHIKENRCKSVLCMPILSKGELKGILYLENNLATGVFDQRRKENLIPIAAQLAISLENAYLYEHLRFLVDERTKALQEEIKVRKRAEEKLARMANYDALTGLPNRRLFHKILSRLLLEADTSGYLLAVLYMDLDGFKEINDTFGHDKGDLVLEETARRLIRAVRGSDIVSRIGGDEFVLLLDRITTDEEIRHVCERILSEIRQPFQISENLVVELTASIGVSVYPKDAQDEKELLSRADQAMYRIKKSDKNYYSFTEPLSEAQEIP